MKLLPASHQGLLFVKSLFPLLSTLVFHWDSLRQTAFNSHTHIDARAVPGWDRVHFPHSCPHSAVLWQLEGGDITAVSGYCWAVSPTPPSPPNTSRLEWARPWEGTEPGHLTQLTKGISHVIAPACSAITAKGKEEGRICYYPVCLLEQTLHALKLRFSGTSWTSPADGK